METSQGEGHLTSGPLGRRRRGDLRDVLLSLPSSLWGRDRRRGETEMSREVIVTGRRASVPISPAVKVGNTVYCSGQIGIDPATGQIAGIGVKEQTEQTLKNLKAVLEAAGSSLEKVDKTTVFITNQKDYEAMNEVYSTFFPQDPPARSCVVVAALARPGLIVEIECIAHT